MSSKSAATVISATRDAQDRVIVSVTSPRLYIQRFDISTMNEALVWAHIVARRDMQSAGVIGGGRG